MIARRYKKKLLLLHNHWHLNALIRSYIILARLFKSCRCSMLCLSLHSYWMHRIVWTLYLMLSFYLWESQLSLIDVVRNGKNKCNSESEYKTEIIYLISMSRNGNHDSLHLLCVQRNKMPKKKLSRWNMSQKLFLLTSARQRLNVPYKNAL